MKLKFLKATDSGANMKATVHSSGKLGFSGDAIKQLNLSENMYIEFAQNEDENDKDLYALFHEEYEEGRLKLKKAGQYYYLNTKNLFNELGIPYRDHRIIFDIIKKEYDGKLLIKLIMRKKKKKTE